MDPRNIRRDRRPEGGYVLVGVLILVALSGIIAAGSLNSSSTTSRTTLATERRDREFFTAEDSLGRALTWMRANSTSMTYPFSRENFYSLFDRSQPTVGANDTSVFQVPTRIKLRGTNNSAILVTNASLGTGSFPLSVDTVSGATFNALTRFTQAGVGEDLVRVTLVDAIAMNPAQDFGDTDLGNAPPTTDFYPMYRIDAMRSPERGGHLFGYVVGTLVTSSGMGFYGRDHLELRQSCDSYISSAAAPNYAAGNRRANCTTGSHRDLRVHGAEKVYGSGRSNGSIADSSPFEADNFCANFGSPCTPGPTCSGTGCGVPQLPTYQPWNTYCPSNKGNVSAADGSTITVPSNNPSDRCWGKLTVGNKIVTTLTTTQYGYFFEELDISNNSQTQLRFAPSTAGGTINIYVKKFTGDRINASTTINVNNRPVQLRIHYLGTDTLEINGNATMNAFIVAPYAAVNFSGSSDFSGGIKARELTMTGSADVHYDESGDIATLSDVTYKIRSMNQYYR